MITTRSEKVEGNMMGVWITIYLKSIYQSLCLYKVCGVFPSPKYPIYPNMAPSSFPIRLQSPNLSASYESYNEGYHWRSPLKYTCPTSEQDDENYALNYLPVSQQIWRWRNKEPRVSSAGRTHKGEWATGNEWGSRPAGPRPHVPFATKFAALHLQG